MKKTLDKHIHFPVTTKIIRNERGNTTNVVAQQLSTYQFDIARS
jgi:hypothetical protein